MHRTEATARPPSKFFAFAVFFCPFQTFLVVILHAIAVLLPLVCLFLSPAWWLAGPRAQHLGIRVAPRHARSVEIVRYLKCLIARHHVRRKSWQLLFGSISNSAYFVRDHFLLWLCQPFTNRATGGTEGTYKKAIGQSARDGHIQKRKRAAKQEPLAATAHSPVQFQCVFSFVNAATATAIRVVVMYVCQHKRFICAHVFKHENVLATRLFSIKCTWWWLLEARFQIETWPLIIITTSFFLISVAGGQRI